jgi:hypothetical protein
MQEMEHRQGHHGTGLFGRGDVLDSCRQRCNVIFAGGEQFVNRDRIIIAGFATTRIHGDAYLMVLKLAPLSSHHEVCMVASHDRGLKTK